MRNLDKFRQAVESPKSWNSMSYIFLKKYVLSFKTLYTKDLSNITFNYLYPYSPNSWCHFWNHKLFFSTQLVRIVLAQTLHTFDKNISWKCKFSDFPLHELKFIKVLMSFSKQKVSFSLKFGSLFSVIKDHSFVLFHLKPYRLSMKGTHQKQISRLSTSRIKINQSPCHFSNQKSVFS